MIPTSRTSHSRLRTGFTLIEVLMVLILIGVLTAIGLPSFINLSTNAKISVTTDKLNDMKRAIVGDSQVVQGRFVNPGYESHMGTLPNALTDLTTQGAQATYNPFTKTGWRGPYISSTASDWNLDAWGTAIVYSKAGRSLTSYGPNKVSGGGDDITITF